MPVLIICRFDNYQMKNKQVIIRTRSNMGFWPGLDLPSLWHSSLTKISTPAKSFPKKLEKKVQSTASNYAEKRPVKIIIYSGLT